MMMMLLLEYLGLVYLQSTKVLAVRSRSRYTDSPTKLAFMVIVTLGATCYVYQFAVSLKRRSDLKIKPIKPFHLALLALQTT